MRNANIQSSFSGSMFIKLKNDEWLKKQRIAGKIAAGALMLLSGLIKEKTTKSLIELDLIAEEYIIKNGGIPTFKGYGSPPFPNSCCISVNNQLVHGVVTNYILQEGDLVSFDLGVTIEGVIADTAITCIYGEAKTSMHTKLLKATKEALKKGIDAAKVGNRIGDIGNAIYKSAKNNGFNVIINYGGHGIDINTPHAFPFVPNKAQLNEGIRIQPGLTIAIEPLLTPGPIDTWVGDDNWTVYTKDINNHMEHTIFVHNDSTEIITDRQEQ